MPPPAMDFESVDVSGPNASDIKISTLNLDEKTSFLDRSPILADGHPLFSLADIPAHRANSAPLPTGVAPFTSSAMFQSRHNLNLPRARDFAHRLTLESRTRQPSSLKAAAQY